MWKILSEATHKSHDITILSLAKAKIFLLCANITAKVLSVSLTPWNTEINIKKLEITMISSSPQE